MKVIVLLFITALMLSATTRALISPYYGKTLRNGGAIMTTRFLTSASSAVPPPPTSIVSICQDKIQKALEAESVKVTGAYDDPNGSHISIQVVSTLFEGKRPMQRQQLVYKAIWEELQGPVHAVDSMICKTPSEQ